MSELEMSSATCKNSENQNQSEQSLGTSEGSRNRRSCRTNESLKEMDSNPTMRHGAGRSTRTTGERRGRPYSHRGGLPQINLEVKHYTTIWQAELNYRYAAIGCTSAYSTDKLEILSVEKLVPCDLESKQLFQQLISNLEPGSRSARLYDMLVKLTFARSQPVAREFFEVYFFVLIEYAKREKQQRQQSREQFVEEMSVELLSRYYRFIRDTSSNVELERREFQKLMRIISNSLVAAYENDLQTKEILCYKM